MRFKELREDEMTEPQRAFYREYCVGRTGSMGPPTRVLLRCPELATRSKKVQEYVRSGTSLPDRIKEFAILIAARYWSAQFAWHAHCSKAIEAGLSSEVATALAQGTRPSGMRNEEAAAYQFCTELHENKNVSDATFDAAVKQFGENGVIDLIAVSGHYTLVSMLLNVNKTSLPGAAPLPPLSRPFP